MGSTRARIAIDAMGGDFAPSEIVVGALRAREELDVEVLLVGDVPQIEAILNQHTSSHNIEIVASEGTIEMHEEPLSGLKRKPKASINVAMDLVKQSGQMQLFQPDTLGRLWQRLCCVWDACRESIAQRLVRCFRR